MEFSASHKKEPCNHEEYCHFSETICIETDFQQHCQMKDSPIEEMHLLEKVKERVERDNERAKQKEAN